VASWGPLGRDGSVLLERGNKAAPDRHFEHMPCNVEERARDQKAELPSGKAAGLRCILANDLGQDLGAIEDLCGVSTGDLALPRSNN